MAYASVDELAERWRDLSESERKKAAVLLEDAAVFLDAELERCHLSSEGRTDKLRYVSCQMVIRAMQLADYGDASSISRTAGSFTEQIALANPGNALYLKSDERRLLGVQLRRGRIAQVGPCG